MEDLTKQLTPAQALQVLNNAVKTLALNFNDHVYLDSCVQVVAAALPKEPNGDLEPKKQKE